MSDAQATILALAALLAALATIWKVLVLPTHRMLKRMSHFLDDWFGESARPGRMAVLPMPERIARLERGHADLSVAQTAMRTEVKDWMEESTADRKAIRLRLDAVAETVEGAVRDGQ